MDLNPTSSRTDRKTIERNRRNQMKVLYSKLNSLVPHQATRELTSLPDQLDEAVTYIKKLQISLEKMKEKKNSLMGTERTTYSHNSNAGSFSNRRGAIMSLKSPHIEIHEMGSALEVVLITGLDCQFMFNETIRVLHEEGADIVNASFSAAEDTIFHTIHCQIGESALGGASRISERLKKFVDDEANIAS